MHKDSLTPYIRLSDTLHKTLSHPTQRWAISSATVGCENIHTIPCSGVHIYDFLTPYTQRWATCSRAAKATSGACAKALRKLRSRPHSSCKLCCVARTSDSQTPEVPCAPRACKRPRAALLLTRASGIPHFYCLRLCCIFATSVLHTHAGGMQAAARCACAHFVPQAFLVCISSTNFIY